MTDFGHVIGKSSAEAVVVGPWISSGSPSSLDESHGNCFSAGMVKPKISCTNIWKVFGSRSIEAIEAIQKNGLCKEEVRESFGCVVAVAGVSFEVMSGEIFCIMGLSGSGKSTVVRLINRLIEPTLGQFFIDGVDIGLLNPKELRDLRATKMGMVFQDRGLLPHRNVRDNVAFALELRKIEREKRDSIAEQVLDLVQLSGWGDLMPGELSGGMQQRVGIARALAANPDILLMDEPFGALDPLIRRELQTQFLQITSRLAKTTVFITHDLDEAIRLGSRIAIMRDGEIVQVGTAEEIITNPADDYVADFVRDISRLNVVRARTVMEPVASYKAPIGAANIADSPRVHCDATLAEMLDVVMHQKAPLAVVDQDQIVGVVTLKKLLGAIRGLPTEGGFLYG